MKRLLTIGHSYVVGLNRRLAHELAVAGAGEWEVTAVAPRALEGDLRRITLESLEGERCRLIPLPMAMQRVAHLRHYRRLQPIMRERWDVVHCWEEPYVAAGWQVARSVPPGARFVFATFQNIAKRYPPPLSWMERAVTRRADGWIPFGWTAREALSHRAGYAGCPARVIPPGVDLQVFRADPEAGARIRAELGWDDGAPVVGFLGRFVPEKGVALLLEVLESLRSPWRALFVGGGPLGPSLLRPFQRRHPSAVRVVEQVRHDQVPAYLNAMDVLCAPSETTPRWREQFGRMLIEAMACGVCVAGSDSGEIPRVIGEAGVVLPERNAAAWVAAIESLLADEARRLSLRHAGRRRAEEEFAWPVVARRHLAFFDEVGAA